MMRLHHIRMIVHEDSRGETVAIGEPGFAVEQICLSSIEEEREVESGWKMLGRSGECDGVLYDGHLQ
jgi:hypothetical protein